MTRRQGFTLVELLITVAIISLLVAICTPALRRARDGARMATCTANLHQMHAGSMSYAVDNINKFPDPAITGRFSFRMAPGMFTPNEPAAQPEIYSWGALLSRTGHLPWSRETWVCPSQPTFMADFGATYAFSVATALSKQRTSRFNPRAEIIWDNFTLYPGLTGFMGPFSSYTIPADKRPYPHAFVTPQHTSGISALQVDGAAGVRSNFEY